MMTSTATFAPTSPRRQLRKALVSTSLVLGFTLGAPVLTSPTADAHKGHTDATPWQVCRDASLGDSCEWSNEAQDRFIGSCREVQDSLLCVRNRPIVPATAHTHGTSTRAGFWYGAAILLGLLGLFRLGTKRSGS